MNDNAPTDGEWRITLASLVTFIACMFTGCGFLFSGAWWLLGLFVVVGVAYVAVLAWHLERGSKDKAKR